MARVKPVKRYSELFLQSLKFAIERGTFEIPCKDHKEALALRGQFYSFRYALRREAHELQRNADKLMFEVDGERLIIHMPAYQFTETLKGAVNASKPE